MYNNDYGFVDFYGDWSDVTDEGHVFGWISSIIDLSWVTSDDFDVTLRLWNARIDRVELVANTAPVPAVPEPATMLLLGTGLVGLVSATKRKMKK